MDFTQLLNTINQPQGAVELFPVYYKELQKIAHRQLNRSWSVQTIQTTALINEAYIKLQADDKFQFIDKSHFFALCARAMRQIIINYAEQKRALKRGGMLNDLTYTDSFSEEQHSRGHKLETLLDIDKALHNLSQLDEELGLLVELRFFAGLTEQDIAQLLDISERTVRRNWLKAKILLSQTLNVG